MKSYIILSTRVTTNARPKRFFSPDYLMKTVTRITMIIIQWHSIVVFRAIACRVAILLRSSETIIILIRWRPTIWNNSRSYAPVHGIRCSALVGRGERGRGPKCPNYFSYILGARPAHTDPWSWRRTCNGTQ